MHWLPIPERIDFKLLLLTFKSLNDVAPPYMEELLVQFVIDQQELRVLQIKDSWYKLQNTTLKPMITELFQSVNAHVLSWALSNQHSFLCVLFSRYFILFFYYLLIFLILTNKSL